MKKNITKRITQIILYLFEIAIITTTLVVITTIIQPISSVLDVIERYMLFYGIYQLVVYLILNNCNDIRKDSYLALLTNYKLLQLYKETNTNIIKSKVVSNINYQLKESTFNDSDIKKEYEYIQRMLNDNKNDYSTEIQYKIILFEHMCEEINLIWKYSFILRCAKNAHNRK